MDQEQPVIAVDDAGSLQWGPGQSIDTLQALLPRLPREQRGLVRYILRMERAEELRRASVRVYCFEPPLPRPALSDIDELPLYL